MAQFYILENNEPVKASWGMWAKFMSSDDNKNIFIDKYPSGVLVSTVFLGIDHNFSDEGPPILFETMIFGGEFNFHQSRCSTYDEAKLMHMSAINKVLSTIKMVENNETYN